MSQNWKLLLLIGSLNITFVISKHKIFIGCLVPSYAVDFYGYQAAIELAAEMINNRSDILPEHELVMVCGDTFAYPSFTIRRVVEFTRRPWNESIRLVIGPAWSKTTVAAYQTCSAYKMVELSYSASSAAFQNNLKYMALFTNVPSTSAFNNARLSLIQHFGWKRVAILREYDDQLHTAAVRALRDQIIRKNLNITIITIEGFSQNTKGHPRIQLENLQKLDARIIIGEFSTKGAVEVFCEAYKMGMFGPKYVWLMPATTSGSWIFAPNTFHRHYRATDCNVSQLITSSDGFFVSDKVPIREDNAQTLSGLTPATFTELMHKRHGRPKQYTGYAFDSVWAAALLYQQTYSFPQFLPENLNPETNNNSVFDVRYKYSLLLSKTEFQGITGPHHFDRRQRLGTVRINQMRNVNGKAKLIQVGTLTSVNKHESEMTLFDDQYNKLWKDGKIPADETTKEKRVLKYSVLQLTFIAVFAIFGLVYSLIYLYFNVSKRHHKAVRMSSPMINNVVLLGCFLCYVFVLLLGIDSRFVDDHIFGILCNVRLYVLAIAFSLAFGALFSKTWRVHKIFTAQRAIKKKLMRDFHLILFVLVLVVIDVIFITVWVNHDPLEMKEILFHELTEDTGDLITTPVLKICECTHRTELLGALYGYKGSLLLFGVFLAWETRNVTIPALNDSKYIGISVYNVVILSAIGATVSIVLKKTVYYELLHVIVSVVVILSTTVTLTMVFAPKVYEYYMNPPEPEERTRTMETLQMRVRSMPTADTDVYEAYFKPKDVKNKWIQTEHTVPGNCDLLQGSPTPFNCIKSAAVANGNHVDTDGHRSTSAETIRGPDGELGIDKGSLQDDERAVTESGVYIGLDDSNMGSSEVNEGFCCDDEKSARDKMT